MHTCRKLLYIHLFTIIYNSFLLSASRAFPAVTVHTMHTMDNDKPANGSLYPLITGLTDNTDTPIHSQEVIPFGMKLTTFLLWNPI